MDLSYSYFKSGSTIDRGCGEGNRGNLSQAPSVSGELFQIRLGSSFTSLVLLISIQPAFVLWAYAADANFTYFILCGVCAVTG